MPDVGSSTVLGIELKDSAEIHECGVIREARGLLHVASDDYDATVPLQFVDQLLDVIGGAWIEGGARVEQDHLWGDRDRASETEPLLPTAR